MTQFTTEQLIERREAHNEITNLVGRLSFLEILHDAQGIWESCWCKETEGLSLGLNDGYYVGAEAVEAYYNALSTLGRARAGVAKNLHPDVFRNCSPDDMRGVGSLSALNFTTPVLEIAGDGNTAKGLWYSPGQVTVAAPDGVHCRWVYAKYGVDFIREGDEWKIWHLFIGEDFSIQPGERMKDIPVPDAYDASPRPDVSLPMRAYTSRYNASPYPAIPAPYNTFDACFGNGPEGNPNYRKDGDLR
jgi:hypothetical protein